MFSKKQKVLFQSEVAYSIVGGLEQALAWKKVIQDKEPCSCSCSRLTALKAGLFYFDTFIQFSNFAKMYFTIATFTRFSLRGFVVTFSTSNTTYTPIRLNTPIEVSHLVIPADHFHLLLDQNMIWLP